MFGVNVESVTIVVTGFLLGLGMGSLVGGRLSTGPPQYSLAAFGVLELGIGCIGWNSLALFKLVDRVTMDSAWMDPVTI